MRRAVLLLVTTALALIAAGGIALAATNFTCTTDPCEGTTDDDVITGTLNAETINGKAGNDEISARDGNDTLNGEDGNDAMHGELGDDWLNGGDGPDQLFGENGSDRLNGGAGNDTLDGSPSNPPTESLNAYYDYYNFNPNWGNDTIIDSRGRGVISVADASSAAAMPNLTVNLVSDPTRPEVTDGNGNTMNWVHNDVMNAVTGAGNDVISMRPKVSNGVNGGAGSDTYTGYTTEPTGEDNINDPSGTADVLDLSSSTFLGDAYWRIWKNPSTGNVRTLQLWTGPPSLCEEEFCRDVFLNRYFDDTSTDVCASGPGAGLIETIKFADGLSADFEQVKRLLGCPTPDTKAPTVANVVPTDGEQNVATGTYVETTFTEAMNPDTINTSTFILTQQDSSTPVEATVGYDNYDLYYSVAWLSPNSELAPNTTYTATIKGGASGAKDLAGNALEQDYSWTFTTGADTTPPETFIDSGPSGNVSSTAASFSFTSSEASSIFQCSRDGSSFTACTSPKSYPGPLSQGSHAFRVRAIDKAGNIDSTPASRSWFVDTAIPKGTISINSGKASTSSRSVTLKLSASDPSPASGVASMRFRNEGTTTWSGWFDYSTSTSWTLSTGAGTKTVNAQYKDKAGNISAAASDAIKFSP